MTNRTATTQKKNPLLILNPHQKGSTMPRPMPGKLYDAEVYENTQGGFNWRCTCGAMGHDTITAHEANRRMESHVERIHALPHMRAHEESLSVPNVRSHADTTDDMQQARPSTQGSRGTTLALSLVRERWALFTDSELNELSDVLFGSDEPDFLYEQINAELRKRGSKDNVIEDLRLRDGVDVDD